MEKKRFYNSLKKSIKFLTYMKLNKRKSGIFAAALATGTLACLAEPSETKIWNIEELYRVPNVFPAEKYTEYQVPGVRTLLYESVPFQGKPTKVFAYYSAPAGPVPSGGWPAVVLVHGGGGTAYAEYVKKWNSWGYAAISMDRYGKLPRPATVLKNRQNLEDGWRDDKSSLRREDSWHYQAIAQIILAHSLIRSFPEVNPEKIGIVGASWGGVHASIAAAVDTRFKFAVMVYSSVLPWCSKEWWEPGKFIPSIKIPTLWVKGTGDVNFTNSNWQHAVNICGGVPLSSLVVNLGHSDNGQIYPINRRFSDSIIKGGTPLPKVDKIEWQGNQVTASVASVRPILNAELCYTCDTGSDAKQVWKTIPAAIKDGKVSAELPEGTKFFFINVFDESAISGEQAWPFSSAYLPTQSGKN